MHGSWEQSQARALLVPGGLMDDSREEQVGGVGVGGKGSRCMERVRQIRWMVR